ncbi:MAG: SIMPL domain-containing protein [Sphingomicrobium sp.]
MRHHWSFLLFASAATLSACGPRAADPRGLARDETLVSVTASGRADTRPDEARLQLGVQSIAASAAEASRANRDKMTKVGAALTALGVKPDDLQTRSLTLQRIDYGSDKGHFRADNLVEVKLRAMDRVGEAVASVTEAGANVLGGPELRISDREASSKSAYAAAYRAARGRAEAYAGAADLKIARVLSIQDAGEYGTPMPYARTMSVSAMDVQATAAPPPVAAPPPPPSAPFNPGVSSQEVRVRVEYALTPK